jgi:hypothetical protein
VTIEFELTREDWMEAAWVHRRRRPVSRRPRQLLTLLGFAVAGLGMVLLTLRPDGGGRVAPIALLVTGFFIPLELKRTELAQTAEAWEKRQRLRQPMKWVFADEGIHVTTPLWEVKYQWGVMMDWAESPGVLLLYQIQDNYSVIPKRAVPGADALATLRELFRARIAGRAVGFPVVLKPR